MNRSRRFKSFRTALLFTTTFLLILFIRLIPLDLMPGRIAPPDILFALLIALLVRRPKAVPMPLIVALFLLNDILLAQPLGLWTLVVFATSEVVRGSRTEVREMLFLSEWVWFAGLYVSASFADFALRVVLFIPRDSMSLLLPMIVFTIAIYPLTVLFINLVFRVEKPVSRDFGGMAAR